MKFPKDDKNKENEKPAKKMIDKNEEKVNNKSLKMKKMHLQILRIIYQSLNE